MPTPIKLSIITVNLNNAKGLKRTIDSVANQTFTNYEHIIIDGGSTDGSVEIIKDYENYYMGVPRGLYWLSGADKGIYNAMNKGIKVATGEYCMFLNSGDWLYNKNVILKFNKCNTIEDIVYGNQYVDFKGQFESWRTVPDELKLVDLIFGSLPHQSMFFKTALFKIHGGYNENYKIISDWEYYLKLFINTNTSFVKIDVIISVFDTNGISKNPNLYDMIKREREEALYSIIPKCYHSVISENIELKEKYNGLLSSNSIKYALKISKILQRFKQ